MRRAAAINQREIARRLGVSVATVSRALRAHPGQGSRTRAEVLALAAELGYRLPATSAACVEGRRIALVASTFHNPPAKESEARLQLLHGATEACRQERVLLQIDHLSPEDEHRLEGSSSDWPILGKGAADGILLIGAMSPASVAILADRHPCVRVIFRDADVRPDRVGQNDTAAVQALVERLAKLGHKKMGYFCRPYAPALTPAHQRFGAWVAALATQGLPWNPELVVGVRPVSQNKASLLERAVQLTRSKKVTAWVCSHDSEAYDLVRGLLEAGVQVPRDVSVTGFDHLSIPEGLPPLTTIEWPFADIGSAAVRLLLERIAHPNRKRMEILLQGSVVPGLTDGTPPALV